MNIRDRIAAAIARNDAGDLDRIEHEMEMGQLTHAHFRPDYFDALLVMMQEQSFLDMDGSWTLLSIFEADSAKLTESQKSRLAVAFESIFPLFRDWHGPFYISEILSEFLPADRQLEFWHRMRQTNNGVARAFVPHGLEHLIRSGGNPSITGDALRILESMRDDADIEVRAEVAQSLGRLHVC